MDARSTPSRGRGAEAARNDRRILDAARAVFIADPGAPIVAVAERAGVGISALYRRFGSKEGLLRRLCGDGLRRYIAEVEAALADAGDPWAAFARFMRGVMEADTHSLTVRLAGTFAPTEDLGRDAVLARTLAGRLLDRTRAAGVIRADIEVDDLSFLFEQLATVNGGDRPRTDQLRARYLALMLDALQHPSTTALPGPAPTWQEISRRWDTSLDGRPQESVVAVGDLAGSPAPKGSARAQRPEQGGERAGRADRST